MHHHDLTKPISLSLFFFPFFLFFLFYSSLTLPFVWDWRSNSFSSFKAKKSVTKTSNLGSSGLCFIGEVMKDANVEKRVEYLDGEWKYQFPLFVFFSSFQTAGWWIWVMEDGAFKEGRWLGVDFMFFKLGFGEALEIYMSLCVQAMHGFMSCQYHWWGPPAFSLFK